MTAAGAVVGALRDLGAGTFAFASPYVATLNDLAVSFIEALGLRCAGRADVARPLGNEEIAALTPGEITALAERADADEADAIVFSCTDMRAVEAVAGIERRLGKPVVTSNQALLAWGLRRLGIPFDGSPLKDHLAVRALAERPGRTPHASTG